MRILYFIFFVILLFLWVIVLLSNLIGINLFKKYNNLIFNFVLIITLIVGLLYIILMFIGMIKEV